MKTLALTFVAILLLPSSLFSQPIEISTPEQLQAIGADETSLAGEYILVNDIDLTGVEWTSIVGFVGTFDGNGHVVKGITQDNTGARAAGLFGKTLAGSVVKNVGVVDVNIASSWYTAALVGDCFGTVENCYATGTLRNNDDTGNIGTFIGLVRESGVVSNCYCTADLEINDNTWEYFGGMFGNAVGVINNCYFAGTVSGNTPLPYWVLRGGGDDENAAASSRYMDTCYYDADVAGLYQGPGAKSTDDMMMESTFVGWDFANVWSIDEGQGYPQLRMFLPPNPKATGPLPEDGGIIEATFVELTWTAGAGATTNNVYISDDEDAVAQGTVEAVETTEASLVVGTPDAPLSPSLTPGMTYYWRVDAVGDETTAGDVWSFSVAPETAYAPSPADGARVMDPNVILSWKAGLGAIVHYVTVGESFDEVDAAELGLGIEAGEATLDIGQQEPGKIIYWRVDELNGETGEFIQGQVWSFATAISVIEDFEVYKEDPNDPSSVYLFAVWQDGWSEEWGNGTGALVGNDVPPYAEQDVVHSGAQAMPLRFDNSGQTDFGPRALYSETWCTFIHAKDWSGETTLGLWYRGRSENTAETLSVVITDAGNNSVVIENTAEQNAVQSMMWTEWVIPLGGIEGVDLSQVKTLAIRIGDPGAQQPGSKGKIYIDDIAIYPQQTEQTVGPVGYWKLDETSGAIAQDSSGNGHDGILSADPDPAPVWTTDPERGNVLEFVPGLDYVDCGPGVSAGQNLTVALWIKPADVELMRPISCFDGDDYSENPGWFLMLRHDDWGEPPQIPPNAWFRITGGVDPETPEDAWNSGDLWINECWAPGEWLHMAFTFDEDTDTLSGYINGQLAGVTVVPEGRSVASDTNPLIMGHGGGSEQYEGLMDDVCIYDVVLTEAEILNLAGI